MNDEAIKLVWRMVLATMAGRKQTVWELYENYLRKRFLYVSIKEILEAKGRKIA